MNQHLKRNDTALLLLLFISLLTTCAQSQRIFSSVGILASSVENKVGSSVYNRPIIRSSTGLGFETKAWHRLSFTAVLTHFTSGGKRKSYSYNDFNKYDHLYFDNYSLGAIGNFYMVNKKTQFYIGIGPRLEYVTSQQAICSEWDGSGYAPHFLRELVWGVSGNIGVNFQLDNFNLGIKSNYYYRPYLYKKGYEDIYGQGDLSIKDQVFDLQLVFGYTFGKIKSEK
jgi:hypothetical protein